MEKRNIKFLYMQFNNNYKQKKYECMNRNEGNQNSHHR
jgi:hypothetical protein